jgi:hypothetical protein
MYTEVDLFSVNDRLNKLRRGLKVLSSDNSFTPHERFRFLNEIRSLDSRIRKLERVLTIEVKGDFEFSNLFESCVLNKPLAYYDPSREWRAKAPDR